MGAIPAEIFEGRQYGSIFGTVMLAAILGGAAGPWVAGVLHDYTGSYSRVFGSRSVQPCFRRRDLAGGARQGQGRRRTIGGFGNRTARPAAHTSVPGVRAQTSSLSASSIWIVA